MAERQPRGMISSVYHLAAERDLLRSEMWKLFGDRVDVLPEDSIAGTDADIYLEKARDASFIVILLTQAESEPVLDEIRIALDNNIQIAAFSLRYPPHVQPGSEWRLSRAEQMLREGRVFVRSVSSITELRTQFWRGVANYLSDATRRYQRTSAYKNYELFREWLQVRPRRVALVQRTSTLLLGPRRNRPDEIDCHDQIKHHVRMMANPDGANIEFLHVFAKQETEEAFLNTPEAFLTGERSEVLARRRGSRKNSPFLVKIAPIEDRLSPCLIVDDHVVLGSSLGQGNEMMSIIHDKTTAAHIWGILSRHPYSISTQKATLDFFGLLSRP